MDLTTIKFKKVEYVECSQILEYAGHVKDLLLEIKELEAKNQLTEKDNEIIKNEMESKNKLIEKENEVIKKEIALQEEKHKNALLVKEMEYMKIINELLMKKP